MNVSTKSFHPVRHVQGKGVCAAKASRGRIINLEGFGGHTLASSQPADTAATHYRVYNARRQFSVLGVGGTFTVPERETQFLSHDL